MTWLMEDETVSESNNIQLDESYPAQTTTMIDLSLIFSPPAQTPPKRKNGKNVMKRMPTLIMSSQAMRQLPV